MIVATCGTCKGKRYVTRPNSSIRDNCPQCGGMGNVPATAARDALIHDVLGPVIGGAKAGEALDLLAKHRREHGDWLREIGALGDTRFGLRRTHRTGQWGHAGADELWPDVVSKDFNGPRLWLWWE